MARWRATIQRLKLFRTSCSERRTSVFKRANELGPKYAYTALWLDIAERRNNIASHLALAAKQLDMTTWLALVVRLFGSVSV